MGFFSETLQPIFLKFCTVVGHYESYQKTWRSATRTQGQGRKGHGYAWINFVISLDDFDETFSCLAWLFVMFTEPQQTSKFSRQTFFRGGNCVIKKTITWAFSQKRFNQSSSNFAQLSDITRAIRKRDGPWRAPKVKVVWAMDMHD